MANTNIGGSTDPFYRYKMPKLVAKIEGRGNGIKTNVVNNVEIAKALARPPGYVIKFFGCELGAQTTYDKELGTSIVNGAHDQKTLSEVLDRFIKKYVQCYQCGNPETTVKISKKDDITLKCKACGAVSDVDPRQKLNTFILKNPPENKLSKEEKRLKKVEEERLDGALQASDAGSSKDKKEKKKDKEGKEGSEKKDKKKKKDSSKDDKDKKSDASPQDDDMESPEDEDDDVTWSTPIDAEAVRKRAAEQLSDGIAALVSVVDVEAEAEQRRQKEAAAVRKAQEAEEAELRRKEEEAAAAAAEVLARQAALLDSIPAERIDAARAVQLLSGASLDDSAALVAAVRKLNVEGGMAGRMRVLYEALLPRAEKYMYLQMKAMLPVFAEFAGDAQGQLAQLIALEHLLAEVVPEKQKETAKLLETMYKEKLAEDDIIIAWYDKEDAGKILGVSAVGAEAVRAAAKPVYDFLQDDDEDDSEEESDDE